MPPPLNKKPPPGPKCQISPPPQFLKLAGIQGKPVFLWPIYLTFNFSRISKEKYFLFLYSLLFISIIMCLQSSFLCIICSFHFCPISLPLVNTLAFPGSTTLFSILQRPVISLIIKLLGCIWRKQLINNDSSVNTDLTSTWITV